MNIRWAMYTISFLASIVILVTGFVTGERVFVLTGIAIGIGLYFSRGYINPDNTDKK